MDILPGTKKTFCKTQMGVSISIRFNVARVNK